jgi:hypothetical protein
LNGYLESKGADPVDFSEFETLQGSTATGAENIGSLTNLQHLNVLLAPECGHQLVCPVP